jgi:hypothetical protein
LKLLLARVLVSVVLGVCLAASPSPPPTIIRVQSSGLCTTLRENVGPVLIGLIKNDQILGKARHAVALRQERASTTRSRAWRNSLSKNSVSAIVHNLAVTDRLLENPKRFAAPATSNDRLEAASLKQQL